MKHEFMIDQILFLKKRKSASTHSNSEGKAVG